MPIELPPINGRERVAELFRSSPLPAGANPGLVFQRYLQVWRESEPRLLDKQRQPALRRFVDAFARAGQGEAGELLAEAHRRLDQLQPQRRTFVTTWNLTLGLGAPHPLENGFSLDPILGVPFIPGSSIKGLCRAYAELEGQADIAAALGERDAAGELIFLPAYPKVWPCLVVDVVNCHHPEYYRSGGARPALDNESPVPVYFLAVPAGTAFEFRIASRADGAKIEAGFAWLARALDLLGIGAKTAAGYGRLRPA